MQYKRGQASTEALFIIGTAVLLVFVLLYAVLPVLVDFSRFSDAAQAERSLEKIAGAAEAASSYGPGTKTTLYVHLPPGEVEFSASTISYTISSSGTTIVKPLTVQLDSTPQEVVEFSSGGIKKAVITKEKLKEVKIEIS